MKILEIPTNVFGDCLQKQVEDRLKFYESGTLPPKNVDVMQDAVLKAEEAKNDIIKKDKKKKKKEKKNKKKDEDGEAMETGENGVTNGNGVEEHLEEMNLGEANGDDEEHQPKKKKKKNKKSE